MDTLEAYRKHAADAKQTLAMVGTGFLSNPFASVTMICLTLAGLYAFKSPFWALPTLFLTRSTAAVSIAVINAIGNLGGFVGPFAIGYIKEQGYPATAGLYFLAALLVISFLMTYFIKIKENAGQAG